MLRLLLSWGLLVAFGVMANEPAKPHLVLYPDHLAVTAEGTLPSPLPGDHQLFLPVPPEAGISLAEVIAISLPEGAYLSSLRVSLDQTPPWPRLLKGQNLNWFSEGSWQRVTVLDVLPGGLLIQTRTALRLLPQEQWANLRFPLDIAEQVEAARESDQVEMFYRIKSELQDSQFKVRYAYRQLSWQVLYWLQQGKLSAFLNIRNLGKMAVYGESFELVPTDTVRPMPRRVVMADESVPGALPMMAGSDMGQRRYFIDHTLIVAPEQAKLAPLAELDLPTVEFSLLVQDQLFNRFAPNKKAERQLKLVFPVDGPALPGGKLSVLADDGIVKVADTFLAAVEPGDAQLLNLGPSPLVSVKKHFLQQDRESAKFALLFVNHSAEPQNVEYWLRGVKQVNGKQVIASEGYRVRIELPPRGSEELILQGWRQTTP